MKKLSRVFGMSPIYVELLEPKGIRTVLDLAKSDNLDELSATTGVPLELLQKWRPLAQKEVEASRYRRKIVTVFVPLTLVLLIGVGFWSYQESRTTTEDTYSRAFTSYEQGDYLHAAQILDQAFARGENGADLHNLRGVLYRKESERQKAIQKFREAIRIDPKYHYAWQNLGNVHSDMKDYEQAIDDYKKTLLLNPSAETAHIALADLYEQKKNFVDAETQLKAAIEAHPTSVQAYRQLSFLYQKLKKPDLAEGILLRAAEHNPKSDLVLSSLGDFYYGAKRYMQAAESYRKAAQLNPKEPSHWQNSGLAYRKALKWDEALESYRKLARLEPNNWDARFYSGWILSKKSEPSSLAEAIREFNSAVAAAPNENRNKWAYLNLAIAYRAGGSYEEAISSLSEALRIDPGFVSALVERGLLLTIKGKNEDARKSFEQAIQLDPSNVVALYNLVYVLETLGEFKQAQEAMHRLESMAANTEYALELKARHLKNKGNYIGASKLYERILNNNPKNLYILMLLGDAEINAGRTDNDTQLIQKGFSHIEDTIKYNPAYADGYFALGVIHHTVPHFKDFKKAVVFYQKCLRYNPRHASSLHNLASIALVEGRFKDALDLSEQVLQINSSDVSAFVRISYAKFLQGDLEGALKAGREAVKFEPSNPTASINYAEILVWRGETDKAHDELKRLRDLLSVSRFSALDIWDYLILPQYDSDETKRVIFVDSDAQRKAVLAQLEGLTCLKENKLSDAMNHYRASTKSLARANNEDRAVIHKGINDLHRLWKESHGQPLAEVGLGYLYNWLGNRERAEHHWRHYLETGDDPAGLEETRRGLELLKQSVEKQQAA